MYFIKNTSNPYNNNYYYFKTQYIEPFKLPNITDNPLYFLAYLIVSSIQMGATIDYAIVIASRYTELRQTMDRREAIIDTMNLSFPTNITSGPMLAFAGITIGMLTSDVAIYNIGQTLGRGTIISIFITMFYVHL